MWNCLVRRALFAGVMVGAVVAAGAATVVEPGAFDSVVTLETRVQSSGALEGTIRNRGEHEIRDVVVQVRHSWVWPFAGRDRPDTAMRPETVRLAGPLMPGDSIAFRSQQPAPENVPADAAYLGRARVVELTEMHPVTRD